MDHSAYSVAYGESNVGKSFFALDLGMHVAAGMCWHGSRVKGGSVVYIASEGGNSFINRVAALKIEHPDLVEEAVGRFFVLPVTVDLCGSSDTIDIISMLAEIKSAPALVIVDTLARSMGAGDENSAPDMASFIHNIDAIRDQTDAHVLVVHHSGKDASRGARGHSALRGAVDTELHLTRDGDVIQAEAKKQRDMKIGGIFAYQLREVELGRDQDGDAVTTCIVEPCEPPKKSQKISEQAKIALQALGDALANHGKIKMGELFPASRQCVSLETWREYCDRHELSDGITPDAKRVAFNRQKKALHEKGIVRVVDGYVWRCEDE